MCSELLPRASQSLQTSLSGLLSALPATSTAAASIRAETQTKLNEVAAKITLSSSTTPCGEQVRTSDVDPVSFKVCPGTASSRTLSFKTSTAADAPTATVTFPADASTTNFQVLVNLPSASSFPSPPATYSLVSPVLDITATGLDGSGNPVAITSFPGKITFSVPPNANFAPSSAKSVFLGFFNTKTTPTKWDVGCGEATRSGSSYTATCDHLTAFGLMGYSPVLGVNSVPYWPGNSALAQHGPSALLSLLLAAAVAAFAARRMW
eukprot:tig00021137_g18991.t1